jgi:nucleoside-diphosphate-sugar epimerase
MKIAITGGSGFLGRRLAALLLLDAGVEEVVLADVSAAAPPGDDPRLVSREVNLSDSGAAASVARGADVIYHLAAVVSGQAEAEFDLGMRVNVDATRALLEAARSTGRRPRFVFASSLAVFGPPLPAVVTDRTAVAPRSSYGTQKAMAELLICDYSRRGFVDGRVLRLPTVCVRPGKPNAAASSFVSAIIREPLHGERANCPVGRAQELWLSSPATAVANLAHGAALPPDALGSERTVNLPGITVTIGEMIAALERVAGPAVAARIDFGDVPAVRQIISGWPSRFDMDRALSLGFRRDAHFEALVRAFIGDGEAEKGLRRA